MVDVMNFCLWCDVPCGGEKLCRECKAVNEHPPFHCHAGLGHLPTLGDECASCAFERERKERVAAQNAPAIESLRKILRAHVLEVRASKPWPGCEFGKVIVGNSILGALADLGCDKKDELRRATEA